MNKVPPVAPLRAAQPQRYTAWMTRGIGKPMSPYDPRRPSQVR
jgi:hypothetical protein